MKTFSAQKNPDISARQTAQGCLTANLAVPGLGSLLGGRKIGLLQMAIYFSGFALTIFFGFRFVSWAISHWSEFYGPDPDPVNALPDLLRHSRGAFLGIFLFAVSWLWALLTSRSLLAEAEKKNAAPPKISNEKT